MFDTIKETAGRSHKKLANSPLIMWLLGVLVIILFLAGTVTQISTSEYLAQGTNQQVTSVSWSVFQQPWLLLTNQAPFAYRTAWMYGWIVETFTLIFAMALTAALTKIGSLNPLLAKAFLVSGFVLLILNSVADYSSSPGSNDLVRFCVALALGLIVTVGLPLGIGLIEYGCEQF